MSKVGDEQLFYLMSRGMDEAEAMALIVRGFIEPIAKELPLEYAVELNRLIELEMEGSVGLARHGEQTRRRFGRRPCLEPEACTRASRGERRAPGGRPLTRLREAGAGDPPWLRARREEAWAVYEASADAVHALRGVAVHGLGADCWTFGSSLSVRAQAGDVKRTAGARGSVGGQCGSDGSVGQPPAARSPAACRTAMDQDREGLAGRVVARGRLAWFRRGA